MNARRLSPTRESPSLTAAVWTLLAASLALNLARRATYQKALPTEAAPLRVRLDSMNVVSETGEPASISFRSQPLPTILYYFSATCVWCDRNWASVRALEQRTQGKYRFIAVTSDRLTRTAKIPVHGYGMLPNAVRTAIHAGGTPHTYIISTDGVVTQSWPGAYQGRTRTAVERYFGVRLPELLNVPLR